MAAARLLKMATAGDVDALRRFYSLHVEALYASACARVGRDSALAEEVVQETFLVALGRLDHYDPARGTIRAWLHSLSKNVVRKVVRARFRVVQPTDQDALDRLRSEASRLDDALLSDEVLAREETRQLVCDTLDSLPGAYRELLTDKYLLGATVEELARAGGTTLVATKSRLARARHAFRQSFTTIAATDRRPPRDAAQAPAGSGGAR